MSILKGISRAIDSVTNLFGYLAGGMILLTSFIIVYEVGMRSLFNSPTTWVTETSVYLIIGAGFCGMAYALKTDHHIQVDILTAKLSPRAKSGLDMITSIISLVFCIILLWKGWEMVAHSYAIKRISPTPLRVPMYLPQASLFIGSLLLCLQFIRRALQSMIHFFEKEPLKVVNKEDNSSEMRREARA